MRILYLFANHSSMMYQWQKYHIFDEMAQHNCIFDIISPSNFENIEQLNDAIIKRIRTSSKFFEPACTFLFSGSASRFDSMEARL